MNSLKNIWHHIRRSPYQALAAISIMSLTFLVGGVFFVLSFGSEIVLLYFEQKPEIIVFFKDTKKEESIKMLESNLKLIDKVKTVKYVSKEEALSIYKNQFKNDPLLLEMVSADILPASIEVSATKIEYLPELAETLKKETDISDIIFPEDVVSLLTSWTTLIRRVGLTLVVFLSLASLFTVVTVLSMKIALKKEEIEILRLVGAANWYIRTPFLIEGMLYGIVGAVAGGTITVGLLFYATPYISSLFVGIPLFPIPFLFYVLFFVSMIVLGCLLGLLASLVAIGRYLK